MREMGSAPRPGLRPAGVRLFNKSNAVAKVGINVAAGAELGVDEDVAAQLLRQSAAFAKIDGTSGGDAVVTEGPGFLSADPAPPSPPVEEAGGGAARRASGRRKGES